MTYCGPLAEILIKKIELEKKSLDDIAKELCGNTVKRPRQKAIRIIKELLSEDYLIKNAKTLGYNAVKAIRQKSTTDEVVKRKIITEKELENSDNSEETEQKQVLREPDSVRSEACCQAVNTEHKETGDTKEQEQVIEHDTSAACCQERVVPKKIVSVRKDSEEETKEQVVEEPYNAVPEMKEFNGLVEEIRKLINLFTLDIVKRALAVAESKV